MFQSVARTCFRRRRLVVVAWIGLLFAAIADDPHRPDRTLS